MEYIFLDDVRHHIDVLKKYIRPAGAPEHPLLVGDGIRPVDFLLSDDKHWVLPSNGYGLSFATSMKKLKSVFSLKARRFAEVDIYAIDDMTVLPAGMMMVRDRPGHASLVVTQRMRVEDLVQRLQELSDRAERIGRIRISP